MLQEQSVIIATHSAFIFQCPWFIKRQCAGSPTPHPPLPPPTPSLSMISAALRRSVQIESGMDEDVATWVGALCSSDYRLHSREDRQTDRAGQVWQCVLAAPQPLQASPKLLGPMAAALTHLALCQTDFSPFMAWACLRVDTPLSLADSICCFLSLSFLH